MSRAPSVDLMRFRVQCTRKRTIIANNLESCVDINFIAQRQALLEPVVKRRETQNRRQSRLAETSRNINNSKIIENSRFQEPSRNVKKCYLVPEMSRNLETKQIYISRNIRNLKKLNDFEKPRNSDSRNLKKCRLLSRNLKKCRLLSTCVKKRYKHPKMFKPSFVTFLDIS